MRTELIENLKVWLDTYQEDQKVQEDKAQDKIYLDILYDISKYREILETGFHIVTILECTITGEMSE